MGAFHIAVNILYWTCTFNFRPKFKWGLPVAISTSFVSHTIQLGIFGFFAENQNQDVWDFFISTGTR